MVVYTRDSEDPPGLYWRLWRIFSKRTLISLVRLTWVLVNNLYCIPAYFFYMALLSPLLFLSPDTYWKIEQVFFDWLLSMVACWVQTAGYEIHESGDSLDALKDETLLFMPNHQSTADVPLCMTIFTARRGWCKNVMWVMDKVFKYTNFGWVAWMHDDFFILSGKAKRELTIQDLRRHLKDVFVPKERKYLVLFPEGGFLRNRKQVSQSFAKKSSLQHLELCTLPRTGALEAIYEMLLHKVEDAIINGELPKQPLTKKGHRLTKIVDVTIAYPDGKPLDLLSICLASRPPCVTHVHYRVFDISEIPTKGEEMKQWMYQLYFDKEKMLSQYYETGKFPYHMFNQRASPPKQLLHDPLRFVLLHLFFMSSSWLLWNAFTSVYAWL